MEITRQEPPQIQRRGKFRRIAPGEYELIEKPVASAAVETLKRVVPPHLRPELLQAGVSLTNVARLLGHSSEAITERHYSAWVKGRQEQLETAVRQAFPSDFADATGTKPVQRSGSRRRKRKKAPKGAGK